MKLELKHLAPYLPYGLSLYWIKQDDELDETIELWYGNIDKSIEIVNRSNDDKNCFDRWKPIFRPLSDIETFIGDLIPLIDTHSKNLDVEVNKIDDMFPVLFSSYDIMCKLFELHFDVFGLIEKGLAIDINTIKK